MMRLPESRYERLEQLERLLVSRPHGWRTSELAHELAVDADTVRRELALLESLGTGLLKEGWYYRLDHRRMRHTIRLATDEVLALYLAARLLSRYSDEHNPHSVRALEQLADALAGRSPDLARHILLAARSVHGRAARPAYVATLEILTRAWIERRKVHLRYRAITSDEPTERLFAPYFLEPSAVGYTCYVIGFDELRGALRTFKVERIEEAHLTDEPFVVPDDFDPLRLLESAWGVMWRDDGGQEVILRFAPRAARRVKESIWHPSQQLVDLPDGACLFTVCVGHTLELKPWVVRQCVEVLNGAANLTTPKTPAALRSVTMFAESVAALAAHRKRQIERRLSAGSSWQDNNLIFTTPTGGPLNPNNVLRNLAVIIRKANAASELTEVARLPQFHIHDLRHTHATHLLMDGWSVAIVSRRLGHANPAITLQRYAHAIVDVHGEDVATPAAFALTGTDSSR